MIFSIPDYELTYQALKGACAPESTVRCLLPFPSPSNRNSPATAMFHIARAMVFCRVVGIQGWYKPAYPTKAVSTKSMSSISTTLWLLLRHTLL
jgi:hypothetical protein